MFNLSQARVEKRARHLLGFWCFFFFLDTEGKDAARCAVLMLPSLKLLLREL